MSALHLEIPVAQAGLFSNTVIDYLTGAEALKPFYTHTPEVSSYQEAIQRKHFSQDKREVLYKALVNQYGALLESTGADKVQKNIVALRDAKTFTVTTGHQLNIFTGPVFCIYKISTTIKLAEALQEAYPKYRFVPVFWMASEDHDFAEINHFNLFGKKLTWEGEAAGPVGRRSTEGLGELVDQVLDMLSNETSADKLKQLFAEAYREYTNLADATRYIYHHLFASQGLVILDADSRALKAQFAPYIKQDILKRENYTEMTQTIDRLEPTYKAQVTPRPINHFYIDDQTRERIVFEDGVYKVLNTSVSFTEAELLQKLEDQPECFSPNAVLRPLYQEVILPNLGYIGGPAEVAYWMELQSMFKRNDVPFPVVHLRNSFLMLGEKLLQRMDKLGLSVQELFKEQDQLVKDWLSGQADTDYALTQEQEHIAEGLQKIINKAEHIDQGMVGSLVKQQQAILGQLQKIEQRLKDAAKRKSEQDIKKIQSLRESLFPNGTFQERYQNLIQFWVNGPGEELLPLINDHTKPFASNVLSCLVI